MSRSFAVNVKPFIVVFVIASIFYLALTWFWYSTYRFLSYDYAWQTQVVAEWASLKLPTVPMIGEDYSALGNHFSPILALVAPIYAIFPYGFTLNVVLALCFGLAAAIFTSVAVKYCGPLIGYGLGLGLAFSWGFITSAEHQFHEITLAAPLLAFSLKKFIENDFLKSCLWAAPLVLVKEDMGVLLFGLGLAIAWRSKKWRYLSLSAWGAGWTFSSIYFIIPFFANGQWEFSSRVSVDLETLLHQADFKLILICFLILQCGVAGLLSPLCWAIIPALAIRLFTENTAYYAIGFHYNTLIVIMLSFALLDSFIKHEWSSWRKKIFTAIPLVLSAIYLLIPLPFTSTGTSYLTKDYSHDQRAIEAFETLFETIHQEAVVAADAYTLSGFYERGYEIYYFREVGDRPAPHCYVSEAEELFYSEYKIFSLSTEEERLGEKYELIYDTPYIKAWCNSKYEKLTH